VAGLRVSELTNSRSQHSRQKTYRPPLPLAVAPDEGRTGKYEHVYRLEIDDGHQPGVEAEAYRQLFNTIRPHEALHWRQPLDVHLEACNDPQTTNSNEPELLPLS
jgi:hypothetical protein